jgi:hypothetical protein
MTVHGHFNVRLKALGLADLSSCGCCDDETWDHVLKDCPIYDDVRGSLVHAVGPVLLTDSRVMLQDPAKYEELRVFVGGVFICQCTLEGPLDMLQGFSLP